MWTHNTGWWKDWIWTVRIWRSLLRNNLAWENIWLHVLGNRTVSRTVTNGQEFRNLTGWTYARFLHMDRSCILVSGKWELVWLTGQKMVTSFEGDKQRNGQTDCSIATFSLLFCIDVQQEKGRPVSTTWVPLLEKEAEQGCRQACENGWRENNKRVDKKKCKQHAVLLLR